MDCLNIILVHEGRHFKVIAFVVSWIRSRHKYWFLLCCVTDDTESTLTTVASPKLISTFPMIYVYDYGNNSWKCNNNILLLNITLLYFYTFVTQHILYSTYNKTVFVLGNHYACIINFFFPKCPFPSYLPEKLPLSFKDCLRYDVLFKGFLASPQLLLLHYFCNIALCLYLYYGSPCIVL